MWLRKLKVSDAPGVHRELELDRLEPGVNLVWGPNASGKSTVARALRSLFAATPGDGARVFAILEHAGRTHEVVRPHGGASIWPKDGPFIDAGFDPELYALDLSGLLSNDDTDLARRFTEELFGGVDLEKVRSDLQIPSTQKLNKASRIQTQAQQKLNAVREEARELTRRETQLVELRAELERASLARDEAQAADTLLEVILARETLTRLEQERAALDPRVERVPAKALEDLAELREELTRCARDLEQLRTRHEGLEAKRATEAFAVEAPRPEALSARRAEAARLRRLSEKLQAAQDRLADAEAAEATASEAFFLAGRPEGEPEPISEEESTRLHRALADLADARAEQRGAEQLAREAQSWHTETSRRAVEKQLPPELDQLRRGRDALQAWLALTPEHHRAALGIFGALAGVAGLGLGAGLYALVFGLRIPTLLTVLGGLAAIGAVAVYLFRLLRPTSPDADRARFETAARDAGVVPTEWRREAVVKRLTEAWELLADRASHDRILGEARGAARRAEESAEQLHEDAGALGTRLGLAPGLVDLGTHERAQRLIALIEEQEKVARNTTEVLNLQQQVSALREPLRAFLETLGVEAGLEAEGLLAVVEEVSRRSERLATLAEQLETLEGDLARAAEEHARRKAQLADAWSSWGLDEEDETALRSLSEQAPRLELLEAKLREIRGEHERGLARLHTGAGLRLPLDPETATREEAQALKLRLEAAAETFAEVTRQIAAIEEAVKAAGTRAALEDARANLIDAERKLEALHEQGLSRSLIDLCLCEARDGFVAEHRPERLGRAEQLFSSFTRGQWKLILDPTRRTFSALDTGRGLLRALPELSDGTRVHLLLAARLAAIETQEKGGVALPLCLDELLSTTDPERFDEVARALFGLADAGRQIFYFTADPAEVAQWRQAARRSVGNESERALGFVSLVDARVPGAWGEDHELTLPPARATVPPPPANGDANAYARTLGLSAPDGHCPAKQWHLLHLLFDHLEAVPLLRSRGIETFGHWQAAWGEVPEGERAPYLEVGLPALIDLRGALLEETLAAWQTGRGRPLRWEDIEGSGAVSATFVDRFRDLFEETAGDPEAFVAAIDDKRISRFHKDKRDELVAYLQDEGVLSDEAPLEPGALLPAVIARVESLLAVAPGGEREAQAFVEHLLALLAPPSSHDARPQLELIGG